MKIKTSSSTSAKRFGPSGVVEKCLKASTIPEQRTTVATHLAAVLHADPRRRGRRRSPARAGFPPPRGRSYRGGLAYAVIVRGPCAPRACGSGSRRGLAHGRAVDVAQHSRPTTRTRKDDRVRRLKVKVKGPAVFDVSDWRQASAHDHYNRSHGSL